MLELTLFSGCLEYVFIHLWMWKMQRPNQGTKLWLVTLSSGIPQIVFGEVQTLKNFGWEVIPSKTHHFWPINKLHYGHFGRFSWFCYPSFFLIFVSSSFFQICFLGSVTAHQPTCVCPWLCHTKNIIIKKFKTNKQTIRTFQSMLMF